MKGKLLKKIIVGMTAMAMIFSVNTFAFADEGDGDIIITNAGELANAIAQQSDGQTWRIKAGTYNLGEADLAKYADITPGNSGQGNWYFPITESITIIGEGDVTITSDVERDNGAWASQDFVSVWADGVTIENVDFTCKKEVNKAIEVMGKNFTLKDSTIKPVKYDDGTVNSGSVYFNAADVGATTLENVEVHSWISAPVGTVTDGTIALVNTTIDFTDNAYAGNSSYGVMSSNDVFNAENGLTVVVDDAMDIQKQVIDRIPEQATVSLAENVAVDEMLYIQTQGVTIEGNGHQITASEDFAAGTHGQIQLVKIETDNVTIKNVDLIGTEKTKHTLDVYGAENLNLENVTLDHSKSQPGAPLIINGSGVVVSGEFNVITGENSWYGINLDNKNGNATIEFNDDCNATFTDGRPDAVKEAAPIVFAEITENANSNQTKPEDTVINPENAGIIFNDETGFEQLYDVSLVINYNTKDGKTVDTQRFTEKAPEGQFTWTDQGEAANFKLRTPEGYKITDYEESFKTPLTVEVVADAANETVKTVYVEAVEAAGGNTDQATTDTEKSDKAPATGDESNVIIPFIAAGLALMAIAVTVATRRKHNQ